MFIIFSQKILNANNYLPHIIYCENIINVAHKKTQELRILFVKKKKKKKKKDEWNLLRSNTKTKTKTKRGIANLTGTLLLNLLLSLTLTTSIQYEGCRSKFTKKLLLKQHRSSLKV